MCLNTCNDRFDGADGRICRECQDDYEQECNPNSARNRTLRAAQALAAATPATEAEWLAWRRETTYANRAKTHGFLDS